jgi:hypothetical protein
VDVNVALCGNLVVRRAVRERQIRSKPAIQWQIPEQSTRMTGVAHIPVIRRKLLNGLKVLERDIP